MVRSALLQRQRQQQRDEEAAADLANLASRPNHDFPARLHHNGNREFLSERGIDITDMESTTIPATIGQRNWAHFTHTPHPYHPELVREFYASMVPEVFRALGRVWVRGVLVEITADAIREYLHVPTDPDVDHYQGFPNDFSPQLNEMAGALRQNGSDEWIPRQVALQHGELRPDMAFWSVFIKHNILPSTHRTLVTVETAQLLYAIRTGVSVDISHFILDSIEKTCGSPRCLLNFPCLISHFCRRAGIEAAYNMAELVHPPSDIGKKTYNLFCTRHGLPNITVGGRYRNRGRHGAAGQHHEQPAQHAAAPPPPPPDNDAYPDIRETLAGIELRQINQGHILQRIEHYVVPDTHPTDAPTLPMHYRRRHRGDGSGPSSSHPH